MRHKYYDEYGGLIKHYSWSITDKYDFHTHQYYQILRKISWDAIVTSNSEAFNPSKPSKSYKYEDFSALRPKSGTNSSILPPSKTIKIQKLSTVDSKILYLTGNGEGVREISAYLRRYLPHHAPKTRRGPKGKPFSVFYVHTRMQILVKSYLNGSIIESTPQMLKDLRRVERSQAAQDSQAAKASEGGGVKKTGLALDISINPENNND